MAKDKNVNGHRALRRGRASAPFNRYLLTLVTENRRLGLAEEWIYRAFLGELGRLPCETLALVVMPDHLHWLIRLGVNRSLAETVRLFKGRTSVVLREADIKWQRGAYHDRRLRSDDMLSPFLRYMLCNPYRAGYCKLDVGWPYWMIHPEIESWFLPTTNGGRPHVEWMTTDSQVPWQES